MTFSTILVLLFGFQAASTTPLNHLQWTMPGANGVAARTIPANESLTDRENIEPLRSHGSHKQAKQEAPTQTFTGTVEWEYKPLSWDCDVPNCDHFALYDHATQTNYELDDARAALPYEGKRAKVTGVVNTKDSIIHVISIEGMK